DAIAGGPKLLEQLRTVGAVALAEQGISLLCQPGAELLGGPVQCLITGKEDKGPATAARHVFLHLRQRRGLEGVRLVRRIGQPPEQVQLHLLAKVERAAELSCRALLQSQPALEVL